MSIYNYRAFIDEYEAPVNQCCIPPRPVSPYPPYAPHPVSPCPPCPPRPVPPCPPPKPCCIGPKGEDGKSAYQVALDNGFVGTAAQWLESLKAQAEPFRSSYLEIVGNGQTVAANSNIAFDPAEVDIVGTGIAVNAAGTIFTITRPGLYHVEWNLNLAAGASSTTPAIVGILENGVPASGSVSSTSGNFASGTLINVTTVPYSLSLHNFDRAVTLESPDNVTGGAASIRIVRFADAASV